MLKLKDEVMVKHKFFSAKRFLSSGLCWIWVSFALILIDRFSKLWVLENLNLYESLQVLPFFNLTLAYNTGAAFSFLHSASGWQNFFLGGLAIVMAIFILIWLSRISSQDKWVSISLCLILGGAVGNAWDRALYGYVIDFFDFHLGNWHFAIFNVADSAICVGAALLFLNWVIYPGKRSGF